MTYRVLLVDDDAVNRLLSSLTIQSVEGVELETAQDGEEALEMAERTAFDLILMDLFLPGIDGCETTRRIRAKTGPSQHCCIVALTASNASADIQQCLAAGMTAHLAKPIDEQALRQTLLALPRARA